MRISDWLSTVWENKTVLRRTQFKSS
jgi:hypothetical protein